MTDFNTLSSSEYATTDYVNSQIAKFNTFDENFTVDNNVKFLGTETETTTIPITLTNGVHPVISASNATARISLLGKTVVSNGTLLGISGTLISKDSNGNILKQITIPTLYAGESITSDGKMIKYATGDVALIDLSKKDVFGNVGNVAGWTYSNGVFERNFEAWTGTSFSAQTVTLPETALEAPYLFSETFTGVPYSSLANDLNAALYKPYSYAKICIKNSTYDNAADFQAYISSSNSVKYAAALKAGATLSETAFDNVLPTSAGGTIEFVADNTLEPNFFLHTFKYIFAVENAKNVVLNEKLYKSYETGTIYEGTDGLLKFSVGGQSNVISSVGWANDLTTGYAPISTTEYVPLMKTSGSLIKYDANDTAIEAIEIPDLYGTQTIYDEYTDSGKIQRFSEDFFVKSSFENTVSFLDGTSAENGYLFEFYIPESVFGDQIPVKNSASFAAVLLNPMLPVVSESVINSTTVCGNHAGSKMSFSWHEDTQTYVIKAITYKTITSVAALLSSKWYIKYLLETPIIKRNTDKIYLKNGERLIFSADTDSLYKQPSNLTFSMPNNLYSILSGAEAIVTDINELNKLSENGKVGIVKIGTADGITDDSDAIQSAIDAALQTNNSVKAITLPEGTYSISKPIVLSTPYTKLVCSGKVVLKPTGIFPAIKICASNITVSDINIELQKYTGTTTETNNGLHSGIYVDSSFGIYYPRISNVNITGGYDYDVQHTEKSYGIYFKDGSSAEFCYYNYLENCRFVGTYIGLYIGYNVQPGNYNVTFEKTAYGIWCVGMSSYIKYLGQFIGATQWLQDENGNIITDEFGNNKLNNLSKAAVYCSGSYNCIDGFSFDAQRTDAILYFTETSAYNRYRIPNAYVLGQLQHNVTSGISIDTNNDGAIDANDKYYYNFHYYIDFGKENICESPARNIAKRMVGSYAVKTYYPTSNTTVDNTVRESAEIFGVQDNALAGMDKLGTVEVYKLIDDEKVSVNILPIDPNATYLNIPKISSVFSPTAIGGNFYSGVTFDHIPTPENPLYVDITLDSVIFINKFGIIFNESIAKSFEILYYTSNNQDDDENCYLNGRVNKTINNIYSNWNCDPHIAHISKIRITIFEGYVDANQNPDGKVGISYIWAGDGYKGGKSYLPKEGGSLYGDLNLGDSYLKLGLVSQLPEVSYTQRGKTIVLKGNDSTADALYVCMKQADNTYSWIEL